MQHQPNSDDEGARKKARVVDVFRREVWQQCRFALMAAENLQQWVREGHNERVFQSLQSFLSAAASISRLLGGEGEIRTQVRADLGATEDSLKRMRKLRNHFEHFDERLEEWVKRDPRLNIVDMGMFGPGDIAGLDASSSFFRNLDPNTYIATFWDEEFDLKAAVRAVEELEQKAKPETVRLSEALQAQAEAS